VGPRLWVIISARYKRFSHANAAYIVYRLYIVIIKYFWRKTTKTNSAVGKSLTTLVSPAGFKRRHTCGVRFSWDPALRATCVRSSYNLSRVLGSTAAVTKLPPCEHSGDDDTHLHDRTYNSCHRRRRRVFVNIRKPPLLRRRCLHVTDKTTNTPPHHTRAYNSVCCAWPLSLVHVAWACIPNVIASDDCLCLITVIPFIRNVLDTREVVLSYFLYNASKTSPRLVDK